MFYLVQENLFKEYNYNNLINTLERFGFDYEIAKLNPKTRTIEFDTKRNDVFCFGAVMMAKIAKQYKWSPGSMLDDNHDFDVYAQKFGLINMLNSDAYTMKVSEEISFANFERFFVRPVKDSKTFTGQVYTKQSWDEFRKNCKKIFPDEKIVVSSVKQIKQEVRCWVVGGKVITTSRYKIGNQVLYANYDYESLFVDFAQKMVDIHQPAEAFVLDICLTDSGLKIVEVNNINSAGFYDCNIGKLIQSLEDHFN